MPLGSCRIKMKDFGSAGGFHVPQIHLAHPYFILGSRTFIRNYAMPAFDMQLYPLALSFNSEPQSLISYGGLAPIIKLIGRLVDQKSHTCLLEALLCAAESNDRWVLLLKSLGRGKCGIWRFGPDHQADWSVSGPGISCMFTWGPAVCCRVKWTVS